MLTEQLQRILAIEEEERAFYLEHLKPALYQLEHAEDLHAERKQIEQLVLETVFEQTLQSLKNVDKNPEHLYKLTHLFHQQMHTNHMTRQSQVEFLLSSTAQPDLTPATLYYLACIYSKSDAEQDCQRADSYLRQALEVAFPGHQRDFELKIRELLAQNHDRWQLKKNPPQPQKYGTQYADHYDVLKGLEKDQLIRPHPSYQYQIKDIEQARKKLGLCSLAEQEKKRHSRESSAE